MAQLVCDGKQRLPPVKRFSLGSSLWSYLLPVNPGGWRIASGCRPFLRHGAVNLQRARAVEVEHPEGISGCPTDTLLLVGH